MNIREIIEIRDRLKNELSVVERFLEIAKRQGLANGESSEKTVPALDDKQAVLKSVVEQTIGYGSIGKAVLEAIKLSPLEFTVKDVREALKDVDKTITKPQIATALSRLNKQKKVQIIEPKQGRKPAIYRRI